MTAKPAGTISVDLDDAATHLAGYGIRAADPGRLVEMGVERLLPVLERHQIRATFFVIGSNVDSDGQSIAALVRAGHEIASHSLRHPLGLSRLHDTRLLEELRRSRETLEARVGIAVTGFRAPSWDVTRRVLEHIAAAGYRYDASVMPTPLLPLARIAVAIKARRIRALAEHAWLPPTFRRRPSVHRTVAGRVIEFPVSVGSGARWPIYHTTRYSTSDARFVDALDRLVRDGVPLSYPLHAIDAVGVTEDVLDARLVRHPGGGRPLAEKLRLLDETFAILASRYRLVPFRDRLPEST